MPKRKPAGSSPQRKTHNHPPRRRPRPIPLWLAKQKDLDELGKRRCLMVLSVLSGESPVSDAIEEAQISRQLYYDLESRALAAMLSALTPASSATGQATTPAMRIAELEAEVKRLEQEKRRSERLLLLTRKVLRPGAMKLAGGRPRKKRNPTSTTSGPLPSKSSMTTTSSKSSRSSSSTSTKDGGGEP